MVLLLYIKSHNGESASEMSYSLEGSLSTPVILRLDITGKLYLECSDDTVKVFYHEKQKQQVKEEGVYMYRAALSLIGRLNLHKERIDGNDSHDNDRKSSSIVWSSSSYVRDTKRDDSLKEVRIVLPFALGMSVLAVGTFLLCKRCSGKRDETASA